MKKITLTLFSLVALLTTSVLFAEDKTEFGWSGAAALGAIITSGNSDTRNINLDAKAKNENAQWRHNYFASALKTKSDGDKTADRFALGYKADYKLTSYSYLWGEVRYEEDDFSGFDSQLTGSVGYGRRVLDTAAATLDLELGIGQRKTDLSNGRDESDTVIRGALFYVRNINETTIFTQDAIALVGDSNTSLDATSAIKTQLIGNLALEASLKLKYNTDAPAGRDDTDTTTALSLVYEF